MSAYTLVAAAGQRGHRRRVAVPARRCSTTRCRSRPRQFAHFHDHWIGARRAGARRHRVRRPPALRLRPARRRDARPRRRQPRHRRCATALARLAARPARARCGCGACTTSSTSAGCCSSRPILELRCGDADGAGQARARSSGSLRADRSLAAARAGSALRGARELVGRRTETLGAEWTLLYALRLAARCSRPRAARPPAGARAAPGRACRRPASTREPGAPRPGDAGACARSPRRSRRCELAVRDDAPAARQPADPDDRPRALLRRLHRASSTSRAGSPSAALRVRIVTVDPVAAAAARLAGARRVLQRASTGSSTQVEVAFGRESPGARGQPRATASSPRRGGPRTSPAHALRALGGERFLYLIQEYEPFTFPMGTYAALAERVLRASRTSALFSTELLRDYFRRARRSASTRRATRRATRLGGVPERDHRRRAADGGASWRPRRRAPAALLRAPRAPRRAATCSSSACSRSAARSRAARFAAAGSCTASAPSTARRRDRPRRRRDARAAAARRARTTTPALLRDHDVGLALMYTPHPSLVPIEMASAGMLTVTNSFENKTAEAMAAISPEPDHRRADVDGVAGALRRGGAPGRRLRAPRARQRGALEPRLGPLARRRPHAGG